VTEPTSSLDPEPSSQEERERQRTADLHGDAYVMYRTPDGRLQLLSLPGSWDQLNIGRSTAAELSLPWDREVSAVHAQLERLGDDWALVDDGLSRNGSFVNDERVAGRRRLHSGDTMRFGRTAVIFHAPLQAHSDKTLVG
jgi:hypothetical protein